MQQTKYVFLLQVRSLSNDFSTPCIIVFKMTYDMSGLTYFLTCEVNIMPFFLLGSSWVLLLLEESYNKLQGLGYIWEMNEQSTIILKTFMCQQRVKIFKMIACFSFKNIPSRSWSKARKCLSRK